MLREHEEAFESHIFDLTAASAYKENRHSQAKNKNGLYGPRGRETGQAVFLYGQAFLGGSSSVRAPAL